MTANNGPSNNDFAQAVNLLEQGNVVAFPTETVYGLGARIDRPEGLKKIFSTKERPFFDPLIVHVSSIDQAKTCFKEWHAMADHLAKAFWPGPLTLVMPKSDLISDMITSGLDSVGVRMPKHPLAKKLIEAVGVPVAAPSANKFGKTSPTKAEHVKKEFGDQVVVLDQGQSEIGIESTVLMVKVSFRGPQHNTYELAILRKGAVLKSDLLTSLLKTDLKFSWLEAVDKKESPGHMKHHYMPEVPFVICKNPAMKLSEITGIINTKLKELPDEVEHVKIVKPKNEIKNIVFLTLSKDPGQAARELYSQLRAMSERKPDVLCFIQMPYHNSEMWESVFDRMYKAASLIIE
ncbi:MAG: L-threonylcarbamoyladenylate synthase [Pseudobdellovibrio sp.]|nr:L-threonylcarbamoyladenylate synthase [Pseudobdellovibrio sp.]